MKYIIVLDDLIKPSKCVMGTQFKIKVKLHQELEESSLMYRLPFKSSTPKGRFTGAIEDNRQYEELPTIFNNKGGID